MPREHMGTRLPKLLPRRVFISDAVLGCSTLITKFPKALKTSSSQRFAHRAMASMQQQQQQHQEQALHILGRLAYAIYLVKWRV